jgi:hypothetical protein
MLKTQNFKSAALVGGTYFGVDTVYVFDHTSGKASVLHKSLEGSRGDKKVLTLDEGLNHLKNAITYVVLPNLDKIVKDLVENKEGFFHFVSQKGEHVNFYQAGGSVFIKINTTKGMEFYSIRNDREEKIAEAIRCLLKKFMGGEAK